MMDQIQEMVQQLTEKEVNSNGNISANLAGSVAQETGNSLMEGLQNAVSGGNLEGLMNMFSGNDANSLTSNPIVKNIVESLTSKLGSNVGLDAGTSSNFASSIIPQLLSMVMGKAKNGEINLTDLLGKGALSALDQNGDGKIGIDDAISALTSGKLGDVLGGFFKK